jgi:hypothetical protein
MTDAAKWGLFDLLKTLDTVHDGQYPRSSRASPGASASRSRSCARLPR